MLNLFWTIAAIMAFFTFVVHTFVGTRFAVAPLRAADEHLPKATIWLNYLCWHIVTGALFILAITLFGAALGRLHPDVVIVSIMLLFCVSTVSIISTTKARIPFYRFPASYLGGSTALVASLGFWQ